MTKLTAPLFVSDSNDVKSERNGVVTQIKVYPNEQLFSQMVATQLPKLN